MLTSSSEFQTENASKYIIQMCKHFAHKVEVSYTETDGQATLPYGMAYMKEKDGSLLFQVEAESEMALSVCQSIIEKHIVRFAFREKLESLAWS